MKVKVRKNIMRELTPTTKHLAMVPTVFYTHLYPTPLISPLMASWAKFGTSVSWLKVLLSLALEMYGVEYGLSLAMVARAQAFDVGLHLRVQPRHSVFQLRY